MSIVLDGSNATTGGLINSGTAQNSTSGTSVLFTGIPATAKRITVMFNGVTTSGSAYPLIQLGISGSIISAGYAGNGTNTQNGSSVSIVSSTAGLIIYKNSSSENLTGSFKFENITGNTWVCSGAWVSTVGITVNGVSVTSVALSGTLTQLAITTSNGTDTFTAGSINILWE
jgi:hypothetical protein